MGTEELRTAAAARCSLKETLRLIQHERAHFVCFTNLLKYEHDIEIISLCLLSYNNSDEDLQRNKIPGFLT